MTRQISAASIKGHQSLKQACPRAGTRLRQAYDLFMTKPVTPLATRDFGGAASRRVIADLTDYYGLDIRQYRHGFWWLVGHTDQNGVYHDFIAHRVA